MKVILEASGDVESFSSGSRRGGARRSAAGSRARTRSPTPWTPCPRTCAATWGCRGGAARSGFRRVRVGSVPFMEGYSGVSAWGEWGSCGDPGRGRVQICHKGASRRYRPRRKARNINVSSRVLRLDRGLCGRFGQTTRVGRAGKASAGRAAAAAGAPTTAVTTSTTPSGLRECQFGKDPGAQPGPKGVSPIPGSRPDGPDPSASA